VTKSTHAFTVHEAKTHLSRILRMVESGAEVQIFRGSQPVARIVPLAEPTPVQRLGYLKGRIWIADDFGETPADIVESFYSDNVIPD
jgi:antitoxin (DNA-binding transcriptional repressor) of toxin-antitoxin stability system